MKKLLIILTILTSSCVFATEKLQTEELDHKVADYSRGNDVEIVLLEPYWSCGACSLFSGMIRMVDYDEIFNAKTRIGKLFNDEVYFKTSKIGDFEAEDLGLTAFPTTVIFKDGKYKGHFNGAVTIPQLGDLLDEATNTNKYGKRARKYLKSLEKSITQ